jgi:hypothetical protein
MPATNKHSFVQPASSSSPGSSSAPSPEPAPQSYDDWFNEQVRLASLDPRPNVKDEDARAQFELKRQSLRERQGSRSPTKP